MSAVREEIPSGAKTDMFGADPARLHQLQRGRPHDRADHALGPQGAGDGKPTPAEAEALFRSMLSYAGPYTIEGDVVTHHVDISWNQSFTGGRRSATSSSKATG